jgi:uncharacterized membrane protein
MRSAASLKDIATGIIIGLAHERISPADREQILRLALQAAEGLNRRIARRKKSNGAAAPG